MVERFPRNKSTRLHTVSSRPTGVLAGSVTIRWGGLSRDPVPGVAKSVCHRDRRSLSTGNSVASVEQTSAALKLSAYICVNRLTPDPVFQDRLESKPASRLT